MIWSTIYCIIVEVLKNGGSIKINGLEKGLVGINPLRFRDSAEHIIDRHIACLEIVGDNIKYNKNAKKYTTLSSSLAFMERSIQAALHKTIKNMEHWQLYPYLDRSNSGECYLGISWKDIPIHKGLDREINDCDFRCGGTDSCKLGCGISEETVAKYNNIKIAKSF